MKKKDVLPCMARAFIGATLFIQAYNSFMDKKMGSLIGLALSFVLFFTMNLKHYRDCGDDKNCDVPKKKKKAA